MARWFENVNSLVFRMIFLFFFKAEADAWPADGYKKVPCKIDDEPSGFLFANHSSVSNVYDQVEIDGPFKDWRPDSTYKYSEDIRIFGSFCPSETGQYSFEIGAYHSVGVLVNTTQTKQGNDVNDWTIYDASTGFHAVTQSDGVKLYANRCYGMQFVAWTKYWVTGSYTNLNIKFKKDDGEYQYLTKVNTLACEKNECRIGYFGADCTNVCDLQCGTHNQCDPIDGIGCRCNGDYQNIFCENTDSSSFVPQNRVKVEYFESKAKKQETYQENLNSLFDLSTGRPYSVITVSGKIEITQNSNFSFKLPSRAQMKLRSIAEPTVEYIVNKGDTNRFNCNVDKFPNLMQERTLDIKRGIYDYEIVYNKGCAFLDHPTDFSVQWKYHRWNRYQASQWESIPERYLGQELKK